MCVLMNGGGMIFFSVRNILSQSANASRRTKDGLGIPGVATWGSLDGDE